MVNSKRRKLNGIVDRIRLVGIELEGGWDKAPEGETIIKDGSVKFLPQIRPPSLQPFDPSTVHDLFTTERLPVPAYKGEIISRPITIEKIPRWVKHCYPKVVNESCGLHVHMSFYYNANYSRLMIPEFTPWIVGKVLAFAKAEELPRDHPQWDRVKKKNHPHCAHLYLGEAQAKMTRKDYESRGKPHSRYTFVNYCDSQHHTVEVRGLAMMETADQAIRAIMCVVTGTNEFLSKLRQREKPERVVVSKKSEAQQEFRSYLRAA